LTDLPWHLVIAGDSQREPAHADELRALTAELNLTDRVTILVDPTPDTLAREWRRTTIFASATRWEGYPTAVAEAMQRGIPTLITANANADGLLPQSAGAICPLEDMASFGKCLRRLLFDTDLRADIAEAALAAGRSLPRWSDRARELLTFLEQHP
jgi:glycosyltransferase involved in cell wall biosynthesis